MESDAEEEGEGAGGGADGHRGDRRALRLRRQPQHRERRHAVVGVEREESDRRVPSADGEESRALAALGDGAEGEAGDLLPEVLLVHLDERSLLVELKVDDLATLERDGNLPRVGGRLGDRPAAWRLPLGDAPVGAHVVDAVGVDLHERVLAQQRARERRRVRLEPRIRHLLDSLADGEHESRVHKAHDNVGVVHVAAAALEGPDGGGVAGELRDRQLRDGEPVAHHAQRRARRATAEREERRRLGGG